MRVMRQAGTLTVGMRLFGAATRVRAYLPPDPAARLPTTPAEAKAPVHQGRVQDVEIADKTAGARRLLRGMRVGVGGKRSRRRAWARSDGQA
jgi:hypothetical protein